MKKTRANGERTIIGADRFRRSVQGDQQIRAIDVGVDEIRLLRDGAVEARQCLVGATELLERRAQQVVSGRVFRRNLDGLTKELDGFRGTPELSVRDAEKAKRIDVLRLEFQNLRIPGRRVGDGAAPVHIEAVLQQSGCQRARHPAPRPINVRAIAAPASRALRAPMPREDGRNRPPGGWGDARERGHSPRRWA